MFDAFHADPRFAALVELIGVYRRAGLLEIACGESRVMLSYSGRERLAKLPPDCLIALLRQLLELARAEQRNRASAELLCAHLDRSMQGSARPIG